MAVVCQITLFSLNLGHAGKARLRSLRKSATLPELLRNVILACASYISMLVHRRMFDSFVDVEREVIFRVQSPTNFCVVQLRSNQVLGEGRWFETTQSRSRHCVANALQDDEKASRESSSVTQSPQPAVVDKRAQEKAKAEKGQTTAIVTGAISIVLAVGYLVLIQFLDTRGINLVPPPPEALQP